MNIAVDVISDVICPWCFIGKRRLEQAIACIREKHTVRLRWLPYQLNPTMPREGVSRKEYRTRKFGSWERSLQLEANVVQVGKDEGITFAFDRIERTPNTVDAHRMIWLAELLGIQDAVVERLFLAYFTEARDLGRREVLVDVAAEAGVDRDRAIAMLESDEGLDVIKKSEELSRGHRVEGVPFFIIDHEITLSGAQPPEVFVAAFEHAVMSR